MGGINAILIIAALILALVLSFLFFVWQVRRNTTRVIQIFRDKKAVGIHNARAPADLGLHRRSMLENAFLLRDYKANALDGLIQSGAVQVTKDGRMYLTEEALEAAKLPE
jgi:hypothetical protein